MAADNGTKIIQLVDFEKGVTFLLQCGEKGAATLFLGCGIRTGLPCRKRRTKREFAMKFGKYFAAVAAASMAVAPAMAAPANPAASLSVAKSARAGTSAKGEQLAGGGIIVAIIAAAAVIVGIVIVADEDDSPSDSN
jgi:hypothetical protein